MANSQSIQLGVDTSGAERELAELGKSINALLADKAKAAGKTPKLLDLSADKAALLELKKQFQELLALSKQKGGIGAIVGVANGANRPSVPSQINLAGVSSNPKEQAAFMERVLTRLLTHHLSTSANPIHTGLTAQEIVGRSAQHGGGAPAPQVHPPIQPKQPDTRGGLSDAAKHLIGQAMAGGTGGVAGAMAGAGAAGAARGIAGALPGGLLGGGLIGLAGYGLFKAASTMNEGLDKAKAEAIELDRLKKALGDVGVSFDALRDNIRNASEGMGVSFEQAGQTASTFAKMADTRSKDVGDLGGETANALALARATGISPEATAQFMGEMRAVKSTSTLDDSRRMSLMVADAIKRSGGSINTDRMLESMTAIAERTKELTLGPVNMAGYGGLLSGLIGGGLKAGTATGLINTFDAATRNPGNEVQDAFVYNALGGDKLGHVNALRLRQGGLMASTNSIFKDQKSPHYDPSMQGSDTTNIQRYMDYLDRMFPGKDKHSKDMREAALSTFFGGNYAHAAQFSATYAKHGAEGLNKTSSMLDRMGIPLASVKTEGMLQLADIANAGGMADLQGLRTGMMARKDLTKSQEAALEKAGGETTPDGLRSALANIAKDLDAESNQGQVLNDLAKTMDKNIQEMATGLIPASIMTNKLLGALVDEMAPDSDLGKQRRAERSAAEKAVHDTAMDAEISKAPASMTSRAQVFQRSKDLLPLAFSMDKEMGLPRGTVAGMIETESTWNPNAVPLDEHGKPIPGNTSHGLGQLNNGAWKEASKPFFKKHNRDPSRSDARDQVEMQAMYMGVLKGRAGGDVELAQRLYRAGGRVVDGRVVDAAAPEGKVADTLAKYKANAANYAGMSDAMVRPMPTPQGGRSRPAELPAGDPARKAAEAAASSVNVSGNANILIRLADNEMQRAAEMVNVPLAQKSVGKPQASGARP